MNPPLPKPWYREPWPWFLMSGPFLVIIAAFVSAWFAISSSDGLVSEDYYKQGLSAEKTIASSELAQKLGISAAVALSPETIIVRLSARDAGFVPPPTLGLILSHPTRAGLDQTATLHREGDHYVSQFRLPRSGHWLVLVEDEAKSWRLMGNVVLPASGETVIGGERPADIRNM